MAIRLSVLLGLSLLSQMTGLPAQAQGSQTEVRLREALSTAFDWYSETARFPRTLRSPVTVKVLWSDHHAKAIDELNGLLFFLSVKSVGGERVIFVSDMVWAEGLNATEVGEGLRATACALIDKGAGRLPTWWNELGAGLLSLKAQPGCDERVRVLEVPGLRLRTGAWARCAAGTTRAERHMATREGLRYLERTANPRVLVGRFCRTDPTVFLQVQVGDESWVLRGRFETRVHGVSAFVVFHSLTDEVFEANWRVERLF